MLSRKRIAILTLSFGAGHARAAETIEQALADEADIRCLDAIELGSWWFRWLYVYPYWWMIRYWPALWGWLSRRRRAKLHRGTAPVWVFRYGCRELLKQLVSFAPDLVISTEVGAAELAALLKRSGRMNVPVMAVLTDFQAEPPWVQREIDLYCVPAEEVKAELMGWGVLPNRVVVTGIPVDPAFALAFEKEEVRQALGLDARRPVVLVMGGGMGPMPMAALVEELQLCGLPIQVLGLTGHDQKLQTRLETLRGKIALDLVPFGWTNNIPELMAASDLLITKPGGLTLAEALTVGLPMVLTHPIPGPEERHCRRLVEAGVAVEVKTLNELPEKVASLLNDHAELDRMRQRAHELARPEATYTIAQVAHALLERASYIDLLSAPSPRRGESAYLM